jgi:methionine--tRNA ligase beta chain
VKTLKGDFYNLIPGTPVSVGNILFQKIEVEDLLVKTEGSVKVGAGVKGAPVKPKKVEVVEEDPNQVDFTKMDFRVGVISKVWYHETAERLFCEEIDVGEEAPRPVASGLRQFYSLEEMQGRKVVVVCNLKESKLQGFMSCGMVLAAKVTGESGLEGGVGEVRIVLVEPPEGSTVGDRVYIDGLKEGETGGGIPLTPARVKKLKVWEAVVVDLSTDSEGVACWKDKPLMVAGGAITAKSAPNSPIS